MQHIYGTKPELKLKVAPDFFAKIRPPEISFRPAPPVIGTIGQVPIAQFPELKVPIGEGLFVAVQVMEHRMMANLVTETPAFSLNPTKFEGEEIVRELGTLPGQAREFAFEKANVRLAIEGLPQAGFEQLTPEAWNTLKVVAYDLASGKQLWHVVKE